jgi:hypothetical protein
MKTEVEEILNIVESRDSKQVVAANLIDLTARLDGVAQTMGVYISMLDDVMTDKSHDFNPTEIKAIKSRITGVEKAVRNAVNEAENLQEYFEFNIL